MSKMNDGGFGWCQRFLFSDLRFFLIFGDVSFMI